MPPHASQKTQYSRHHNTKVFGSHGIPHLQAFRSDGLSGCTRLSDQAVRSKQSPCIKPVYIVFSSTSAVCPTPIHPPHAPLPTSNTIRPVCQIFYEEAITVMKRRDCDASVKLLETAVELAGADSRRGGEFKLWAAQALQGVGRNKQAVEVLKSLKGHRDLDVRKVLIWCARACIA